MGKSLQGQHNPFASEKGNDWHPIICHADSCQLTLMLQQIYLRLPLLSMRLAKFIARYCET